MWQAIFGVLDMSTLLNEGSWEVIGIIFFSAFLFFSNVRRRQPRTCMTPGPRAILQHLLLALRHTMPPLPSACRLRVPVHPGGHTGPCPRARMQIVLLNMLIVMMREMYKEVRATEKHVFLRGRAQLIVEVETLMTKAQLEKYAGLSPPYLHMLLVVQRSMHAAESTMGRLERIETRMDSALTSLSYIQWLQTQEKAARGAGGTGATRLAAPDKVKQRPGQPVRNLSKRRASGTGSIASSQVRPAARQLRTPQRQHGSASCVPPVAVPPVPDAGLALGL